jgi:hypothetical protein
MIVGSHGLAALFLNFTAKKAMLSLLVIETLSGHRANLPLAPLDLAPYLKAKQ